MTDTPAPMIAIPLSELPDPTDVPVKRGRKPLTAEQKEERNAKDRARRARKTTRRAPTTRGPKSLREPIAAMLTMVNTVIIMSPLGTRPVAAMTDPTIEPERIGDELDAAEIAALASSIDMQCQRSPRFRKYVEAMLSAGSGGALLTTIGIIATRRAARHGLAPAALDPMLGLALAGDGVEALVSMRPPTPTTEPDPETGERPPMPVDLAGE